MKLHRLALSQIFPLMFALTVVSIGTTGIVAEPQWPELTKLPMACHKGMENTPLVFKGRQLLLMKRRDDTKFKHQTVPQRRFCYIIDLQTGDESRRITPCRMRCAATIITWRIARSWPAPE